MKEQPSLDKPKPGNRIRSRKSSKTFVYSNFAWKILWAKKNELFKVEKRPKKNGNQRNQLMKRKKPQLPGVAEMMVMITMGMIEMDEGFGHFFHYES